jgi:hypothetical protein
MRPFILVSTLMVVAGCGVQADRPRFETATDAVSKLTYAKDPRTDQCYALVSSKSPAHVNDQSMTITWVPCDPKVLVEINRGQEP